jgi:hypothetical protein
MKIFISYRREDSEGWAGHIAEKLQMAFGESAIFYDYESIGPSSKWMNSIEIALKQCQLLLVIIGPRWANIRTANGEKRLDDPHDLVRFEISTALKRRILILPVLVGNAPLPLREDLPKDLAGILDYQVIELPNRSWKQEIEVLIRTTESIMGMDRRISPSQELPSITVAEELLLENAELGSIAGVRGGHRTPAHRIVVAKKATIRDVVMQDIVGIESTGKGDIGHAR